MLRRILNSYIKKRLFLAYRKQQRSVKIITLADAKSIGILWNPIDEESHETYELLRKILSGKGIKSSGIAYINSKREKETMETVSSSRLVSNITVSLFGRPRSSEGIQFVNEQFDVLIDLSINKNVALQYILIHSRANLKVGWRSTDPNFYDLEIDVTANPNCRYLMEQVVHYLEKLNKNS